MYLALGPNDEDQDGVALVFLWASLCAFQRVESSPLGAVAWCALLGSCLDSSELNPLKLMSSLPDAALIAAAQHVGFLAEEGGVVGVL
ncbi:hypothetical protein RHMOL_Rhmol03G0145400 [Rhododendron molle]|uniref:Uncharacterized protein n=1 Tax=Rhododendron molle TaxID=49168 RepID=A0ACC0PFI3_RHOML|nr:hypothetical protein RHMOL_Rhmol03G0145400 [Rhododendron molle]